MKRDLTEGSVLKNVLVFSAPFLLSYLLQTLYGLFDLYFIGLYNGADVTTAVSVGSQIMHMVTVVIVGLCMGVTVLIGRAVGGKDFKQIGNIIGNAVITFAIFTCILTALMLLLQEQIVGVMKTPVESFDGTCDYLFVCFIGIPFVMGYNIISAIFRGLGDSKSPMIFVTFSCAMNIVLDYIIIGVMGQGAMGAAIATVFSQGFCTIVSFIALWRKKYVRISRDNFRYNSAVSMSILKCGAPVAVQDFCIQISFLLITVIANSRGVEIAAAVGIVEKIISFLFLVPSAMLSTISAVAAQNIGAGKRSRAIRTFQTGFAISVSFGLVMAILFQFVGGNVVGLFTSDDAVIYFGQQYIRSYVFDCVFAAMHFCFSGYFVASGYSIISFIHNIIAIIVMRVPGAYLASKLYPDTLFPMGCAAPLGSIVSTIICFIAFIIIYRRQNARQKS